MNEKEFESVKNLHMNWYTYALKALIGQLGRQLYLTLKEDAQRKFADCLYLIPDDNDLKTAARCLIKAKLFMEQVNSITKGMKSISKEWKSNGPRKNSRKYFKVTNENANLKSLTFPSANSSQSSNYTVFKVVPEINTSSLTHSSRLSQSSKKKNILISAFTSKIQKLKVFKPTFNNRFAIKCINNDSLPPRIKIRKLMLQLTKKTARNFSDRSYKAIFERKFNRHNNSRKDNFKEKMLKLSSNLRDAKVTNKRRLEIPMFRRTFLDNSKSTSSYRIRKFHLHRRPDFKRGIPFIHKKPGRITIKRQFEEENKLRGYQYIQLRRFKRSPYRLLTSEKISSFKRVQSNSIPHLLTQSKTPIQRVTNLIRKIFNGEDNKNSREWSLISSKLSDLKNKLEEKKRSPSARPYNFRLYDIVLGNDHATKQNKKQKGVPGFLKSIYELISGFGGRVRNGTNIRFLSPRIAPLIPDKIPSKSKLLSPSILALYKDDSSDSIASIPQILEKSDLGEKDRKAILEMIMDVSGAKDAVDRAFKLLSKLNNINFKDELVETTSRLENAFEKLRKSFSFSQRKDFIKDGFTFLETNQIKQILTDQGVKNPKDVDFDVEMYANLTRTKRIQGLWNTIEQIANGDVNALRKRSKRSATHSILEPVILAPYMFSPVTGLSVLGPVILSPSIFSPLILNPSILGPFIMSPALFMPFIISPYVLSPYIMTPIIGAPFILSPYVLSPNVINPYVLSPLILSPYVLCPDILSPQTLGGQILSPSVLSPSFMSNSSLMANVLSPTFLS